LENGQLEDRLLDNDIWEMKNIQFSVINLWVECNLSAEHISL